MPRIEIRAKVPEIDLSDLIEMEQKQQKSPKEPKAVEIPKFKKAKNTELYDAIHVIYGEIDYYTELVGNLQHVHTPYDLCFEILEKIQIKPGEKVLVVSALEFVPVMIDQFGVDKKDIFFLDEGRFDGKMGTIKPDTLVFGLEFSPVQILTIESVNKMKFDYIVGNPPYQSGESETKKLWQEFIKILIGKCQFETLALVTPNGWFYEPDGRKIAQTTKAMMTGNVIFADTSGRISKDFFPGIGEDIGYWIWSKEKTPGVVIHRSGTINDYQVSMSRPKISIDDIMRHSIQSKLEAKLNEGFHSIRVEGLKGMQWQAGPQSVGIQETFSKFQTEEFSQPVRITAANTMFCDPSRVSLRRGICLNISGYYFKSSNLEKYMPDTNDPTAQDFLKILVENDDESKAVYSYTKSRLYVIFTMKIIGKAFNNYALARLPYLGKSKVWTDEEIYQFFGLTAEEVQYLESFEMP